MTDEQLQVIKMQITMASTNVDNVLHNVVPKLLAEIERLKSMIIWINQKKGQVAKDD